MMNHKRILVALSLSEGRDAAFERALALAKTSGAELYLLHAIPAGQPFSYGAAERLRRSTALRRRAEAAGVRRGRYEQQGDPAEIIVLHADARSVDLVVMGRDSAPAGRGGASGQSPNRCFAEPSGRRSWSAAMTRVMKRSTRTFSLPSICRPRRRR